MATNAQISTGITFQRGDGATPTEVFTTIAEIEGFDGPSGSATVIDASHFQSTARDKLMGLLDEGQITITGNFVGSDAQQTGLRTDRTNKTLRNFKITLVGGEILTFASFVLEFSLSAPKDDKVSFSSTLEISDLVTYA